MKIQLNKFGQKSSYWAIFALIALFGVIYIVQAAKYFIPLGNDGVIFIWPVGMFMGQSSLKDFFIALISSFLGEDHLSPVNNLYGYVCYLLASDPSLVLNITTKLTYLFFVISSLLVVNRLWKDNLRMLLFFLLLTFNLSLTWRSMVHPGISLYIIAPLWCLFFIDRYLKDKRISDIILFSISFLILTISFETAFVGIPLLVFYVLLFILDTQAMNFAKAKEVFKIYSIMFISFLPYLIIHYWLYGTLIPKSRTSFLTGGNYLINYCKMIALLLNEWSFGVGRFLYGNISLVSIAIIVTVTFPMIAFIVYSIYKYRLLSRTGFYLFVAFIFQFITVLYTARVESGVWLLVGIVFCMICADITLEVINKYFEDKGLHVVRKVVFVIVLTLIPFFVLLNGVVQPFKKAELYYERPYESSQVAYKTINEDVDRIIMIRLPDAEDLMHPIAFWIGNKIYNKKAGLWLYPEYYQMLFKNLNIEVYNNKNYYPFEYFRQYLFPNPKNKEVILFQDKNLFSRIYLDSSDLKLLRAGVIPYAEQNYFKLYFPDLSAYSKKIEELEFVLTFSGDPSDVKIIYGGKSVENVKINNDKITFYSRDLSLENNLVVNTGSNRARLSLIEVGIPQNSNTIYNKRASSVKGGITIKTSNVPCRYEIKSPDADLSIYGTLDAGSMIIFNTILKRPLNLVYRTFDANRDKQMVGEINLSNYSENVDPVLICPTSLK